MSKFEQRPSGVFVPVPEHGPRNVVESVWRDEVTGQVVTKAESLVWYDTLYWWAEGNMGCDCNRAAMFGDTGEHECNRGANRYVLLKLTLSDGEVFDDFADLNPSNARHVSEGNYHRMLNMNRSMTGGLSHEPT